MNSSNYFLFLGGFAISYAMSGLTYKDSGVDIEAGESLVEKIKPFAKATTRAGVNSDLGGFGALFDLSSLDYKNPVLVSGTDGVGTKLKLAIEANKHDTVGIDLVAMCVNDVLVQGAEPLFFLDYFACGKLDVDTAADVVKGIAEGCKQAGCALIGGETAEMPGMYADGEYDLAGFTVGAVEKGEILPSQVSEGDVLIGLPSSGIHSNGYSLVRKLLENGLEADLEELLTPTKIYVKEVLPLIRKKLIKGLVHVTGGGITENVPRITGAKISKGAWTMPEIFKKMQEAGSITDDEMLKTFNCGIGMVLIVSPFEKDAVLAEVNGFEIGVATNSGIVEYE